MAAKLKKGDKVVVLAGKDKGKEGTIASPWTPKPAKLWLTVSTWPSAHPSKPGHSGRSHPQGDADRAQQPGVA